MSSSNSLYDDADMTMSEVEEQLKHVNLHREKEIFDCEKKEGFLANLERMMQEKELDIQESLRRQNDLNENFNKLRDKHEAAMRHDRRKRRCEEKREQEGEKIREAEMAAITAENKLREDVAAQEHAEVVIAKNTMVKSEVTMGLKAPPPHLVNTLAAMDRGEDPLGLKSFPVNPQALPGNQANPPPPTPGQPLMVNPATAQSKSGSSGLSRESPSGCGHRAEGREGGETEEQKIARIREGSDRRERERIRH